MSQNKHTRINNLSETAGLTSPASAGLLSESQLKEKLGSEVSRQDAQALHATSRKAHNDALILEKKILTRASPLLPNTVSSGTKQEDVSLQDYEEWFGEGAGEFVAPGDVASMFSPAAYLTTLYNEAKGLYPENSEFHIDARRPDLKALPLSQASLDTQVSALSLSNNILLNKAKSNLGLATSTGGEYDKVLEALSTHVGSSGTPYHHHHNRIRQSMLQKDPDLSLIQAAPAVNKYLSRSTRAGFTFDISPSLYQLLVEELTEGNSEQKFQKYFPGMNPETLFRADQLAKWFGLEDEVVSAFASGKNKINEQTYIGKRLNTFINNKYVTLEYTTNLATFTADCQLFPLGGNLWKIAFKYDNLYNLYNKVNVLVGGAQVCSLDNATGFQNGVYYEKTFTYAGLPQDKNWSPVTITLNAFRASDSYKLNNYFTYSCRTSPSYVYLLKLNKLIRLHVATGLPPLVLERIANSVNPDQITDATLSILFNTAMLMKRYDISHEEALVMGKGLISIESSNGEISQWDRIFNTPLLKAAALNPNSTASVKMLADEREEDADIRAVLKRAFQTDDDGLAALFEIYHQDDTTGSLILNHNNLSGMYTLSLWARHNNLSARMLQTLLRMAGLPDNLHSETAEKWYVRLFWIYETVNWLTSRGWSVHDLVLMTRDVTGITPGNEIINLLKEMQATLASADITGGGDTQQYIQVLTPLIASLFTPGNESAAHALLSWADRAKPGGISLSAFCHELTTSETPTSAITSFVCGLAQMALIIHATGVTAEALALFVKKPQALAAFAVEGSGSSATLRRSADMVMALSNFTDWLTSLSDTQSGGAVVDALGAAGLLPALMARISDFPATMVRQAVSEANKKGDIKDENVLTSWDEISVVSQWMSLTTAYGISPANMGKILSLDYTRGVSSWETWQKVADIFEASLLPSQGQVVLSATDKPLSMALTGLLCSSSNYRTTEALNQYLLLDALNGSEVMTSRIAEATSALQTFIHHTLAEPENGNTLIRVTLDRQFFREWTRWNSRFSTWVAGKQLTYYPENFIDPTVRQGQTQAMDDMLQVLGQAQINADTVGDAFQGYLTAFEEVADLETVSGFHNSRVAESGKTWFVGRNRVEPREYWWRSVDEDKRGTDGVLPANAWTAWTKIDIAAQVTGRMIRPVVYRDRLYMTWIERHEHILARNTSGEPTAREWQWSLKLSWLRFDGNWTAPLEYPLDAAPLNALIQSSMSPDNLSMFLVVWPSRNCMLAGVYDRNTSQGNISAAAGLAIYEDLSSKPVSDIGSKMAEFSGWLDTKTTAGLCGIFEGAAPGVENSITVNAGSSVPPGFKTFDVVLNSVSITDVPDDMSSYRLRINTTVTVDPQLPEIKSKMLENLVSLSSELQNTNSQVRAVNNSGGAAILVNISGTYYLHVLSQYFIQKGIIRVIDVNDSTFSTVTTHTFDQKSYGYVRFKVPNPGTELTSLMISYQVNSVPVTTSWGFIGNCLSDDVNSFNVRITPRLYLNPVYTVPGNQVGYDISYPNGSFDTSRNKGNVTYDMNTGAKQVNWDIHHGILKVNDWGGSNEATHTLRFSFGTGKIRYYSLKVYKENGTLRVGTIGSLENGAQYLQRGTSLTRMNTQFARELTERAVSGIDTILSWDTQQIAEPDMGVGAMLTLPLYNASVHGVNKNVEIWIATGVGKRTLLWSGQLSTTHKVIANVRFDEEAVYEGQQNYHLETKYQKIHNTYESNQSIMISRGSLIIKRSSDTGAPKLLKTNVDSVSVAGSGSNLSMDFSGANALYFWELFYYTPMMVMQRFLQEGRFDLAEQWLKYVFNPSGYTVKGNYTSRIWNVRPLEEDTSWNTEPLGSYDPDAVAQNDPMHYKLNAFMRLLDITLGRGDAAYRQLDRDGLNEARTWYQRAMRLLGDAPVFSPASSWNDPQLDTAASLETQNFRLDALSLMGQGVRAVDTLLKTQVSDAVNSQSLFLPEANTVMLGYWEALRIRLFNLRHNLTLDGQPLNLPIYANAADPKVMMNRAVAAKTSGESELPQINDVPALRFMPLLEGARTMASQLIQFGSSLQNILERQDAEALTLMLNTQGAELAMASTGVHKQTLKELAAERVSLNKSLQSATLRRDHYRSLYQENVSTRELHSMELSTDAQELSAGVKSLYMGAAMSGLAPNVFGLANGGMNYEGPFNALGQALEVQSSYMTVAAGRIAQEEQFRRRRQEWEIQYRSAEKEMGVIEADLAALEVRMTSASMQIALMEMQSSQAQAQLALAQTKYTGKAMYSWLRARLSTIFYTWYDLTASRCVMAEKALQWEKGDSTSYLRNGTWNGSWSGLLCGEGLMMALGQMENAWVRWQKRELEVSRTVSLAKLFEGKLKSAGANVTLNGAMKALVNNKPVEVVNGMALSAMTLTAKNQLSIQFGLKELGLLAGFETSSSCRVRSIAVSLPALLSPYQDVHARLVTSATGLPAGCHESAISHGMQDRGGFMADGDSHPRFGEQWLPFEGLKIAPAASDDTRSLALNFEDATGNQKPLLESLSDIILHVQFTAR